MIFLVIFLAGIASGFINTLAGGGSTLVLPVLIIAGMPSPIANATNRIAILFQNITAVNRFQKHGKLQIKPVIHITISAVIGAVGGSLLASRIAAVHFDKILAVVLIFILIMILRPKSEKEYKPLPKWFEVAIFFIVGFYGGFIQVGVGFIFLATLNLIQRYDLVRANAVKTFIVMCYTFFAVVVFAFSGMILWLHGLLLACGNSLGAYLAVRVAIRKGDKAVKIVLVIAIIIACLKLFGFF
jgi:hypothetical protein